MKIEFLKLVVIASLVFAFVGCKDDSELKNLKVTPVKKLYEPNNGKDIVLNGSASLLFEWEPAKAEDSGMILYEIVFDKVGGDFSNPVFTLLSDKNGLLNSQDISHKQLNKIAAMVGIEPAEKGTFKWTVFASKGINPVKAEEERNLTDRKSVV